VQSQHCEDVDECRYRPVCSEDSKCANTVGSFACTCLDGYATFFDTEWGIFEGCVDDNECDTALYSAPCDPVGGVCLNEPGLFSCSCDEGFTGTGYRDADGCQDIDECLLGTHDCGTTQSCMNLPGAYWCTCNQEGFERSGKECFVSGFYRENANGLHMLGRNGKPSLTDGLARQWQLPMHGAAPDYSAGMLQFLINHVPADGTKWDKFSLSPPESGDRAILLTATYFESPQNTPDDGPFECSPDYCLDCMDRNIFRY